MKITYNFANGETSVVEVSEEVGEIIMDSRRKEHADDERQRYHICCSLDGLDFEGEAFSDESCNPENELIEKLENELKNRRIADCLARLSVEQKRRVLLKADGKTLEEIAAIEGCTPQAVFKSIKKAKKIFEKFL